MTFSPITCTIKNHFIRITLQVNFYFADFVCNTSLTFALFFFIVFRSVSDVRHGGAAARHQNCRS